ncbi:30S ribosomal protein S20 [Veillonella sp.]|uniref:30S ribosomal protein S20 n=1 Tax=Veillonella sp. TaxID=1926307 RepID=UPI0029084789|nr:30S ribosomal protein S20 [Veillonella sp.]MDU4009883.1 30S ribosomal protein S20 [Veillonella sp.]
MPNIKSSIRSVKTDAEVEEAKQALVQATSVIDKAASKGVLHKNTAARKKSNLAAKVNAL